MNQDCSSDLEIYSNLVFFMRVCSNKQNIPFALCLINIDGMDHTFLCAGQIKEI